MPALAQLSMPKRGQSRGRSDGRNEDSPRPQHWEVGDDQSGDDDQVLSERFVIYVYRIEAYALQLEQEIVYLNNVSKSTGAGCWCCEPLPNADFVMESLNLAKIYVCMRC